MSDEEQIGQDEIEKLLQQAQSEGGDADAAPKEPEKAEEPPEDGAALGQAEIEALMAGKQETPPAGQETAAQQGGAAEDGAALGQSEIEALMAGALGGDTASGTGAAQGEASAEAEPSGLLKQSEIEAIMSKQGKGPLPTPTKLGPSSAPPSSEGMGGSGSTNDMQALLEHAQQALHSVNSPRGAGAATEQFELQNFSGSPPTSEKATLELLRDVELDLQIELGRTHMELEDVLQLRKGSVVPLEKLAGDPVDIYVNGRLVARGEVLVLNDNFCVRVGELFTGNKPRDLAG
ncbi:MAG: flagellar motor switch protein FliN [Pirellulaceae bacterium]|nr:flagellar motor switch protein FliN [Pirellulaceae bacterium]